MVMMMPCSHNYVHIVYGDLSMRKILELQEQGIIFGGIKENDSPTHICLICLETYPEVQDNYDDRNING